MLKEVFKESLESWLISAKGSNTAKAIAILIVLLFTVTPYLIILKIVAIALFLVYADYKMRTNLQVTTLRANLVETLQQANTGDILLFRSYRSYDLPEYFISRLLPASVCDTYFGHIGLVIRLNNKAYILECIVEDYYSNLTQSIKNGVILQPAYERITEYTGRVHYLKTNIHHFVTANQVIDYITANDLHKKYYFEDGFLCVTILNRVLKYFKLFHGKLSWIITPGSFLNPRNYTYAVKIETPIIVKEINSQALTSTPTK